MRIQPAYFEFKALQSSNVPTYKPGNGHVRDWEAKEKLHLESFALKCPEVPDPEKDLDHLRPLGISEYFMPPSAVTVHHRVLN